MLAPATEGGTMGGIATFLWFDGAAEEAARFYVEIFPNSRLKRSGESTEPIETAGGKQAGSVLTVEFELNGTDFIAMNGGPGHPFTDAISLSIDCKDQDEVDYYWERLTSDGGQEVACGWLKDKFGLSWQVVPEILPRLIGDPDREKADRAIAAMMRMTKIIVADIEKAAERPQHDS
jgi:predicted 3-demethylubiquinone-9 3-methyltransferase (glyoxalase superfamily)